MAILHLMNFECDISIKNSLNTLKLLQVIQDATSQCFKIVIKNWRKYYYRI